MALDAADLAETARFNNTENAIQLLKPLRAQYSTIQDGRSKGKKPAAGELPAVIYFEVIQSIYNKKKTIADEQKLEFTLNYGHYRDFQVKQLKYYIETGDLLNNKKSTLQERVLVAIDKLEKKLKAEQAKLDKAKLDADKAKVKADKAAEDVINAGVIKIEAENRLDDVKTDAEQTIDEIFNIFDEDPHGADAIRGDLLDVIDTANQSILDARNNALRATADAIRAETLQARINNEKAKADELKAKTDIEVDKTAKKLAEAKNKLLNLSAPKAEPKPDLSNIEFSKDCRAEMTDVLNQLSNDYSEVELLCLASLIRKRYTPSRA